MRSVTFLYTETALLLVWGGGWEMGLSVEESGFSTKKVLLMALYCLRDAHTTGLSPRPGTLILS